MPMHRLSARSLTAASIAAIALLSASCGSSESAEDSLAPTASIPFADDLSTDAYGSDDDAEDATDREFLIDIEDLPVDVAPADPLTEEETTVLLQAQEGASADAESGGLDFGQAIADPTHEGTVGVTAEHLVRELAVAYNGKSELVGEPVRSSNGGTLVFSLTEVAIAGGDATSHRVHVDFSYVYDPDEPTMIVGHRADSILLTPYERTS